jgi:hypothetical protein
LPWVVEYTLELVARQSIRPSAGFAVGKNYRFDIADGVAIGRVWMRPDLDRESGARCAEECVDVFERLGEMSRVLVRGLVFDLRDAPRSWGPMTQAALERCCAAWEATGRPLAIAVSNDPLQLLHVRLLVKERAPTHGRTFTDIEKAREYASR